MGVAQVQRASLCDGDDKIISSALSLLIERQTLTHRARGPRAHWSHSTCGERGGNDAALIVSAGHELVRLNIPMEARLIPFADHFDADIQ